MAFDIGEEDDEFGFGMSTGAGGSSGQPTLIASEKTESKDYVGLSRRNLQSDSEEASDHEEGSDDDKHFKRRLRRDRHRSNSREERKRSRSRSLERGRKRSSEDYDPLNT